eukprot:615240_1
MASSDDQHQKMCEAVYDAVFQGIKQDLKEGILSSFNETIQQQQQQIAQQREALIQQKMEIMQIKQSNQMSNTFDECLKWLRALSTVQKVIAVVIVAAVIAFPLLLMDYGATVEVSDHDDPPFVKRVKDVEISYYQHLDRHVIIEKALWNSRAECELTMQHHKEQRKELQNQHDEIAAVCMDVTKYSNAHLIEQEQHKSDLMAKILEMAGINELMNQQYSELMKLQYSDKIKLYAANDTFIWCDMIQKEGLCLDGIVGLCDILMKPNKRLEKKIANVKKK